MKGDWEEAVRILPARPHRITLSPLLKFCGEHDISPAQFDQLNSERFRDWLEQAYRKRAWQRPYRRAVEMFVRCGREYPPIWPDAVIEVRFDNDHYTLGWRAFPELESETDRMLAEMMGEGPRRSQSGRPIRPSTAKARKYYILRAASAIALTNQIPPSSIRALSQVINPAAIETFVEFVVSRRNGVDNTGDLSQACAAFNTIGRRWLNLDKDTMAEMTNIRRTVMPRRGPAEKNKRLVEDFRSPQMRKSFLTLPERVIMRLMQKGALTDVDRALGELAFVTAFLTAAPLRIAEFVILEKGVHIFDRGRGKNRTVVVHIPGHQVKNDNPRTFQLSERMVKLMDIYWQHFRRGTSLLESVVLLPGWVHAHRNAHHLSQQLAKFTSRELGRRITAHQFRVLVGYVFLNRNPSRYDTVRRFLGHKSIKTTTEHYAFMSEEEAFEELDTTINEILDEV